MKLENLVFDFDKFASEMANLKEKKHFDYLVTIVGEDFGDEEGLGCIYILENTDTHERTSVKMLAKQVGEEDFVIPTVSNIWKVADLLEREVFDFYGIKFLGHPDMRRLYLRNDFKGYPFRHQGKIDNDLFISNFRYIKGAFSQHKDTTHTLLVYKDMWLDKKYVDILKNYIIKCQYTPKHYQYSDLGYITLQWVVESITSRGLDKYVEEEFYKPMKAYRTMFTPIRKYSENEIIPTVTDDCLRGAKEICGYTQDEVAAFMGGVAGEAGLFSSASDLFRIYQMLLNGGELEGKRYFKASTVKLFTTMRSSISHRGLGFDRPNLKRPNEGPCIAQAPAQCYGHSGFTGPNVWVDPVNKLVYIFLCNRVSPCPWNNVLNEIGVWGNIQKAIYDSLDRNANL